MVPFDGATVRDTARQLSLLPYKAPDSTRLAPFKDVDFRRTVGSASIPPRRRGMARAGIPARRAG
jgi:hypothetical protein